MISKEFENKLENIFFHVARYGAAKYLEQNRTLENINHQRFFNLCNEGFKIAQIDILNEIRILQESQNKLNSKLIEARHKKDKDGIIDLTSEIKTESYKIELLRNLAFTIIWQIFDGKREIISRFYTGERGSKELTGKGFDAIFNAANLINKNQNKFAFISDLTNNIQVGDLIAVEQDRYEIIEVKTGKKNEEAFRILNFYKVNNIEISKERLEKSFDKKFAEQVVRIHSQDEKAKKVKTIIDTDKGEDPKFKDAKVKLVDSPIVDETYHEELIELVNNLEKKDFAYTSIMGIINVGVYKNDWRRYGQIVLKEINNGFPIYDLMYTLGTAIAEPIFAKPFDEKTIMDLAFGRIKIYIGIDYNMLIKFGNDFGLPMRWSSRKEFANFISNSKGYDKEIFSHDNKGIIIEEQDPKGIQGFVGHGMLARLMFDHIKPETLIMNRKLGFEQIKRELKNK